MLNLAHRRDRWEQMVNEFSGKCKLIKADCVMVDDQNLSKRDRAYRGVAYTHIKLIQEAKARGDKTLLVLEDDCKLIDNTSWGRWLRLKKWCDSNMDKWEIFNPGVIMYSKVEEVIRYDEMYINKIYGGGGTHFIYFNVEKAYQKVLDWVIEKQDIDAYYLQKFNCWGSYPSIAIQRDGFSDIQDDNIKWSAFNQRSENNGLTLIGDFLLYY